jgi:hypothetical protein
LRNRTAIAITTTATAMASTHPRMTMAPTSWSTHRKLFEK